MELWIIFFLIVGHIFNPFFLLTRFSLLFIRAAVAGGTKISLTLKVGSNTLEGFKLVFQVSPTGLPLLSPFLAQLSISFSW